MLTEEEINIIALKVMKKVHEFSLKYAKNIQIINCSQFILKLNETFNYKKISNDLNVQDV